MKRTHTILAAALTMLVATSLPAQPTGGTTLRCQTSDGIVRITTGSVAFRDLVLRPVHSSEAGVVELRDSRTGVTGELDTRSDEGLYLTITEGGVPMQLILPRGEMETDASISTAPASERENGAAVNLLSLVGTRALAQSR
jgi:hypothetical protein